MKLCAVVVTYYPDVVETTENILRYLPWIDHLIIWENTPKADVDKYRIVLPDNGKISYMGTGENVGISKALNQSVTYCKTRGYTHLLTMDQDSQWEGFDLFKTSIDEYENNNNYIFGPYISGDKPMSTSIEVEYLITSGMIVPIDAIINIGGYYEQFKVDGIDTELCLRAKAHGLHVIKLNSGNLAQKYGNPTKTSFLGYSFYTSGYSDFRLYGIMRNHIMILRKHKTSLALKKEIFCKFLISYTFRILFGEQKKLHRLHMLYKGLFDGFFKRLT